MIGGNTSGGSSPGRSKFAFGAEFYLGWMFIFGRWFRAGLAHGRFVQLPQTWLSTLSMFSPITLAMSWSEYPSLTSHLMMFGNSEGFSNPSTYSTVGTSYQYLFGISRAP